MKKFLIFFLSVFIFLTPFLKADRAQAHPIPFVIHELNFNFTINEINAEYFLRIDPIVINDTYSQIDKNKDNNISNSEFFAYGENEVLRYLKSTLNGQELKFEVKSVEKTLRKDEIEDFENYMQINLVSKNPNYKETNEFYAKFDKRLLINDPFGDQIYIKDNTGSSETFVKQPIERFLEMGFGDFYSDFKFTGKVSSQSGNSQGNSSPSTSFKENYKGLTGLGLRLKDRIESDIRGKLSLPIILFLILIIFIAGALHSITPGHGKSIIATFLISKKNSKFSDVAVLGASLTLSHTILIYIMGFVVLAFDLQSRIRQYESILIKVSAVLLGLLALSLIYKGYQSYKHFQYHKRHGNSHHVHEHSHGFFGKTHSHVNEKLEVNNKRDLIYAGFSGGIVPCIDALAIFMTAVAAGKTAFGLVLIAFFSLGLAMTIIIIGTLAVKGKDKMNLEERYGHKVEMIFPVISGTVILMISIYYFFR